MHRQTCTVTMYGDQAVIVTFTTYIEYSLSTSVVGSGSISLDPGGGIYPRDTMVQLTAIPADGWSFTGWSGDLTGNANPAIITMDQAKTVTATFSQGQSLPQNLIVTAGTVLEGFEFH